MRLLWLPPGLRCALSLSLSLSLPLSLSRILSLSPALSHTLSLPPSLFILHPRVIQAHAPLGHVNQQNADLTSHSGQPQIDRAKITQR